MSARVQLGLFVALIFLSSRVDGETPDTSGHVSTPDAPPPPSDDPGSAVVVFAGENSKSPELMALVRELLQRQQVDLRFLQEKSFRPAQVLSGGETDRSVWVFVQVESQRSARLYFRGPRAQRFLLRDLALRDGLDEVGRESIAQIVESSVMSLLRSSAGMSREEVRAALSSRPTPPSPVIQTPVQLPDERAAVTGWLGLRYSGAWAGPDVGPPHGPGAELGLMWRAPLMLRARLSGERWFAQSMASQQVEATLQTTPLRLALDLGGPLARDHSWFVGLGGGIDVVRVEPKRALDATVMLSAARSHSVPMLRAELRYELAISQLCLALTAFADLSLVRSHYDLQHGSATDVVATTSPVRPGAALILAWRPGRW